MKNLISLLFIGMFIISLNAQEKEVTEKVQDANAPVLEFEKEVIDYGRIALNSDGTRVFTFKNIGKTPLVIERVKSSCGCTVPKKPTEPILPGKSGEIEVKYATNRPGGFSKMVTVYSNASEPMKRLRIKGIVIKPEENTKTDTSSQ